MLKNKFPVYFFLGSEKKTYSAKIFIYITKHTSTNAKALKTRSNRQVGIAVLAHAAWSHRVRNANLSACFMHKSAANCCLAVERTRLAVGFHAHAEAYFARFDVCIAVVSVTASSAGVGSTSWRARLI